MTFPLGRICNPTALSISICNATRYIHISCFSYCYCNINMPFPSTIISRRTVKIILRLIYKFLPNGIHVYIVEFLHIEIISSNGLQITTLLPEFCIHNFRVVGTTKSYSIHQPFFSAFLLIIFYGFYNCFTGELLVVRIFVCAKIQKKKRDMQQFLQIITSPINDC